MRFATRINSLLSAGHTVDSALSETARIVGETAVDLNYPEHVEGLDAVELRKLLQEKGLSLNGFAVRFRDDFRDGEFGPESNHARAIKLSTDAIEMLKEAGGDTLTLWLAYDGSDYFFQTDYARSWQRIVDAVRDIADYRPEVRISVEFKPYEPRSFSMVPTTGYTLHLLNRVDRDNVGLTLDFCHMLMAKENPSMGLAIVANEKRLFGVHLNDGYSDLDGGLMFASVNLIRAVEFVYYLRRYNYDGMVYFDTFPVRENPSEEFQMNVLSFQRIWDKVEQIGMERLERLIREQDGIEVQRMILNEFL